MQQLLLCVHIDEVAHIVNDKKAKSHFPRLSHWVIISTLEASSHYCILMQISFRVLKRFDHSKVKHSF